MKSIVFGEIGIGVNLFRIRCAGTCRDGKYCGGRVLEVGLGKGYRVGIFVTEISKGREGVGFVFFRLRVGL